MSASSADRLGEHLQRQKRGAQRNRAAVAEAEVGDVVARAVGEADRQPRSCRQVLHVVREPDRLQAHLRHDRAVRDHALARTYRRDEARIVRDLAYLHLEQRDAERLERLAEPRSDTRPECGAAEAGAYHLRLREPGVGDWLAAGR